MLRAALLILSFVAPAFAGDELTVYELLAPASHQFAIIYDMSTAVEGAPYLFNPIRRGSVASDERIIDAASGKNLKFETVKYEVAEEHGLRAPRARTSRAAAGG